MPGYKADGAKMARSCEGLVPEGNLMIVERYEDKTDAQQGARLKAARHFPQIRKHCIRHGTVLNSTAYGTHATPYNPFFIHIYFDK